MKTIYLLLISIAIVGLAPTAVAQPIPPYVPTNGLIGWWPFDGNANDGSGNNNNGTSSGATLTTDRFGHADSAYFFNGTSSYISISTSASLESPTTGLTMSAWVNLAGYSLVGQPYDPILTKSNSSANGFMYRFDVNLNGTGFYAGINNWTTNAGVGYNLLLNQWYLLSAVLDSFTSYIYMNDSLVNSLPFTTNISNNTLPLEIGRDVPGITEVFNGKIDDVAIWNRALTPQEITNLYNSSNVGMEEPVGENQLLIYPNPATSQINVKVNAPYINSTFNITDQMGKIVLEGKLNSKNTLISINKLSAGIYMFNTANSNTKQRLSIIKD